MKRIILIILTLTLVIGLASCGDKPTEENGEMVIKWMPQNDGPVDPQSPFKAKLEEMFNTKFEFIYIDRSKESELLNVRITSGAIPDLMRRNETDYKTYVKQNVLTEIPVDYIKEKAPTLYEVTKKYGGENIWEYGLIDGKNYGIPLINLNGDYHSIPVWRDDWLKNVGIDKIPETLVEAEAAYYKFVNNDPDKNGVKDTFAMSSFGIEEIFCAYGGYPYKMYWSERDNGTVQLTATIPEMKDALTKLNQYYKDGLIDPEFISGENKGKHFSNSVALWNGKVGFSMPGMFYHIVGPFSANDKGSQNYQNFKSVQGPDATYTHGKPLVGPTGKSGGIRWGTFSGDYLVMGRDVGVKSPKMDKILEILEAQCADYDTYITIKWGIEGKDYELKDGIYTSITETKDRISQGISVHGVGYMQNNFDFVKKSSDPKLYEFADKYATTNKNYSATVWGGLPSDSKYKSVIEKKIEENYIAFITGKRPVSEFDTFVNELNQMGLETLTKEANEWYAKIYK